MFISKQVHQLWCGMSSLCVQCSGRSQELSGIRGRRRKYKVFVMKDPLRVTGCPLCDVFETCEPTTKLHWPESKDQIKGKEFVIVDCSICNEPIVVYGEHISSVTREAWGRILYICRKKFGGSVQLKHNPCRIKDHYHCHLEIVKY